MPGADDPRDLSGSEGGFGLDGTAVPPKFRVLVIEDNADAREALRALLELDGYHVDVAASGAEGVALAQATPPDVAIVDIGLPGMDGYETARRLQALNRSAERKIALIALTGYSDPEDRRRAREAGFDDFLVKPVDPTNLSQALATRRTPGRGSRG